MKIMKRISLITLTYILVISFTGCSYLSKLTGAVLSSSSSHSNTSTSQPIISNNNSSSQIISSSALPPSSSTASATKKTISPPSDNNIPIPIVPVNKNFPVQPIATVSTSQSQLPATFQDFWDDDTGIQGINIYEYGKGLLNADERAVYDQILLNIKQVNNGFTINTTCNPDSIDKVFEYLYNDHSEIFYIHGSTNYNWSESGGIYTYTFTLGYDTDKQTIINMRNQMDAAAVALLNQAMATLGANPTDIDKERAIHDAIVMHCSYDMAVANNTSSDINSFTAYGAFVNGKCVCDGYARAMKILLSSVGIKSLYVTGTGITKTSSGAHAWNMVYVPDKNGNPSWWYVDATFDDPVILSNGTYSDLSSPSYSYWNFSNMADHILGTYLPTANNWSNSENYQIMPQAGTTNGYYDNTSK